MKRKVYYRHPVTNEKMMITLYKGGRVGGTVIHDEDISGPMLQVHIDEWKATRDAEKAAEDTKETDRENRIARLKALDWSSIQDGPVKNILKDLAKIVARG